MTYKYTSPLEKGYKEITISKALHNEIFKYKKRSWSYLPKYYFNEQIGSIIVEHRISILGKVVLCILYPFYLLRYDVVELTEDIKKALFQSKYGSFSSNEVSKNGGDSYRKIVEGMKIV